jgi:hypothetical protein
VPFLVAGYGGGLTYARFRLSTAGGLNPLGAAADGEVEDYQVNIATPAAENVQVDCLAVDTPHAAAESEIMRSNQTSPPSLRRCGDGDDRPARCGETGAG